MISSFILVCFVWFLGKTNILKLHSFAHLIKGNYLRTYVWGANTFLTRDGNGAGRVRVSWSHPHPHNKNSSSSPSPNPTGIQLLTHPHPHRVTGIFLYPYPYPFFYCSIYQLNIFYKKNLKIIPTESWYYQNIQY